MTGTRAKGRCPEGGGGRLKGQAALHLACSQANTSALSSDGAPEGTPSVKGPVSALGISKGERRVLRHSALTIRLLSCIVPVQSFLSRRASRRGWPCLHSQFCIGPLRVGGSQALGDVSGVQETQPWNPVTPAWEDTRSPACDQAPGAQRPCGPWKGGLDTVLWESRATTRSPGLREPTTSLWKSRRPFSPLPWELEIELCPLSPRS